MAKSYSLSASTREQVLENIKEFVHGDKEKFEVDFILPIKFKKNKPGKMVVSNKSNDIHISEIMERQSKEGHL